MQLLCSRTCGLHNLQTSVISFPRQKDMSKTKFNLVFKCSCQDPCYLCLSFYCFSLDLWWMTFKFSTRGKCCCICGVVLILLYKILFSLQSWHNGFLKRMFFLCYFQLEGFKWTEKFTWNRSSLKLLPCNCRHSTLFQQVKAFIRELLPH